jgi:hypothetical protein
MSIKVEASEEMKNGVQAILYASDKAAEQSPVSEIGWVETAVEVSSRLMDDPDFDLNQHLIQKIGHRTALTAGRSRLVGLTIERLKCTNRALFYAMAFVSVNAV